MIFFNAIDWIYRYDGERSKSQVGGKRLGDAPICTVIWRPVVLLGHHPLTHLNIPRVSMTVLVTCASGGISSNTL